MQDLQVTISLHFPVRMKNRKQRFSKVLKRFGLPWKILNIYGDSEELVFPLGTALISPEWKE